jgi:thiol-disulfide isomerase/thioredoxin
MVAKSSDEVKVLLEAKGQLMKAGQQRLVLLEFVASWCGLCTKVAPQVDVRYFNSIIDNC